MFDWIAMLRRATKPVHRAVPQPDATSNFSRPPRKGERRRYGRPPIFAFHFADWKLDLIRALLPDNDVEFIAIRTRRDDFKAL